MSSTTDSWKELVSSVNETESNTAISKAFRKFGLSSVFLPRNAEVSVNKVRDRLAMLTINGVRFQLAMIDKKHFQGEPNDSQTHS